MIAQVPIEVRYAETDAMGIVHHASYVVWLEAARVAWMRQANYPYTQVESQGLAFSVIEINLKYRQPARFGDVVVVECWVSELNARLARFEYRILMGQTLLAEGFSRHLVTDTHGKASRMPAAMLEHLRAHTTQ